jgi:predicted nucleic-acid-binding protein
MATSRSQMIGLDTNILVRYLVQDEPAQSAKATALMEESLSETSPGFASMVVIAETVWVLERAYGYGSRAVASAIERLLQLETLLIDHEREVFTAMVAAKEGRGSFADALIGALAAEAGCVCTLTFDKKALRLGGFELA